MLLTPFLRKTVNGATSPRTSYAVGAPQMQRQNRAEGRGWESLSPLFRLCLPRFKQSGPEPSLALELTLGPLLLERQKSLSEGLGVGGLSRVCKPCSSPCPQLLPHLLRKGGQAGPWRWSWLGLDAISATEQGSLAGSNFLIRTPGLPARWFSALTPLLRNHTPQASPQTTHTHREPHVYKSDSGVSAVGVQERGTGTKPLQERPMERSGLFTQLLATPSLPVSGSRHRQLAPPCLPQGMGSLGPRAERGG